MTFLNDYFQSLIYVQVSPQRIVLRHLNSGRSIAEAPLVAYVGGMRPKLMGVGPEARMATPVEGLKVLNPFAHPRSLVSDFAAAELLIGEYVRRVMGGRSWFRRMPRMVMHPQGDPAGGFTQVELRAFRELALGAMASQVAVYTGPDLTDEQLRTMAFPADFEAA